MLDRIAAQVRKAFPAATTTYWTWGRRGYVMSAEIRLNGGVGWVTAEVPFVSDADASRDLEDAIAGNLSGQLHDFVLAYL